VRQLDTASVAASMNGSADYAFVLDGESKIRGFVTRDALAMAAPSLAQIESIPRAASLEQVVSRVMAYPRALPVVDDDGCYCGSVDRAVVLQALTRMRGSHV
jgi:glycine betaine/proline transport system ATP-binding protein